MRVSSNPTVLPSAVGVEDARRVLQSLRAVGRHRFLVDDVSLTDEDVPRLTGHRQVTDAHLVTLAQRHHVRLVTPDGSGLPLGRARWDAGDCLRGMGIASPRRQA